MQWGKYNTNKVGGIFTFSYFKAAVPCSGSPGTITHRAFSLPLTEPKITSRRAESGCSSHVKATPPQPPQPHIQPAIPPKHVLVSS